MRSEQSSRRRVDYQGAGDLFRSDTFAVEMGGGNFRKRIGEEKEGSLI
jgi:hypothetical protein